MKLTAKNEKLIARISKEESKLAVLTAKKDELLASLQEKISALDDEIKAQEKRIRQLKEQEESEKLSVIRKQLGKKGISVEDFYSAVMSGNLYDIQETLEQSVTASSESTESASTEAETSSGYAETTLSEISNEET